MCQPSLTYPADQHQALITSSAAIADSLLSVNVIFMPVACDSFNARLLLSFTVKHFWY